LIEKSGNFFTYLSGGFFIPPMSAILDLESTAAHLFINESRRSDTMSSWK